MSHIRQPRLPRGYSDRRLTPRPAPPTKHETSLSHTPCWLPTCGEPSHVVLFASADRFAGRPTHPGRMIGLCLRHGGQVYEVIHAWRDHHRASPPSWLTDDLKAGRIPRVTPDPRGWVTTSGKPWKAVAWRRDPSRSKYQRPKREAAHAA